MSIVTLLLVSHDGKSHCNGAVVNLTPGQDLHASLAALSSGDTLLLAAGDFFVSQETLLVDAGSLTLRGQGPSLTRILFRPTPATPHSRFLQLSGASSLTLADLTLRDFLLDPAQPVSVEEGASGGGVLWLHSGSLAVSRCHFLNNSASLQFGGVLLTSSPAVVLSLADSTFLDNAAAAGAVLAIDGVQRDAGVVPAVRLERCVLGRNVAQRAALVSSLFSHPQVAIADCTFEANGGQDGGGIRAWSGNFAIARSVFAQHSANTGSACRFEYASTAALAGCLFVNNTASSSAGGIRFLNQGPNWILNSTFLSNVGSEAGGAVDVDGGTTHVFDSYFAFNQSPFGGALIYLNNGCHDSHVVRNTFYSNAGDIDGGAIRIRETQNVLIQGCRLTDNFGGAVALENGATAAFYDSLFQANVGVDGGAVSLTSSSVVTLINATTAAAKAQAFVNASSALVMHPWIQPYLDAALSDYLATTLSNVSSMPSLLSTTTTKTTITTITKSIIHALFSKSSSRSTLSSSRDIVSVITPAVVCNDNHADHFGGCFFLTGNASLFLSPDAVLLISRNLALQGGAVALQSLSHLSLQGLATIANNTALAGGALSLSATSFAACPYLGPSVFLSENLALRAGGGIYVDSTGPSACPSLALPRNVSNQSPYGTWIAGPPATVQWAKSLPNQLRIGEQLSLSGFIVDLFGQSIVDAATSYSFGFSLSSDIPSGLSLGGKSDALPRSDGGVSFRIFLRSTGGVSFPQTISLWFLSAPSSLSQSYPLTVLACTGAYVPHQLNGEDVCLNVIEAGLGERVVVGILASLGLLLSLLFAIHLLWKGDRMIHLLRHADPAHLAVALLGTIILLISIFPWLQDSASNCVARPWLAALGFVLQYGALASLSFTNLGLFYRHHFHQRLLVLLVLLFFIPNLAILIAWTVVDPYTLIEDIDVVALTLTRYCGSQDTVYIWLIIGFNSVLVSLAPLGVIVLSRYPFQFRQSKHFTYSLLLVFIAWCVLVPVAAISFNSMNAFYLIVTLGLIAAAVLPTIPLFGLRLYRIYYPMEGDTVAERIDFLKSDIAHRKDMIGGSASFNSTKQNAKSSSSITAGFPSTELFSE